MAVQKVGGGRALGAGTQMLDPPSLTKPATPLAN